jgi:hypothetical protein
MGERIRSEERAHREARYRKVRDREPLENLPGGLSIVRAMKHEAIELSSLTREELASRTGKRNGGKFSYGWALVDYVDWVTLVVSVLRWDAKTRPTRHAFRLPEEVGLCRGRTVHTIEVVFDGRNIHAYPVEDR